VNEELVIHFLENKSRSKKRRRLNRRQAEECFQCQHCGYHVLVEPLLSGVHNRNHCPYCLWSRCLDLFEAGDRLSPCKAPMQPLGLALKSTRKRYGPAACGELMLVHRCQECGKVSANRLAADDDPQLLYWLYEKSLQISPSLRESIAAAGVILLGSSQRSIVRLQLFGTPSHSPELLSVLPIKQGLRAR